MKSWANKNVKILTYKLDRLEFLSRDAGKDQGQGDDIDECFHVVCCDVLVNRI